jgi:hypothetical protein
MPIQGPGALRGVLALGAGLALGMAAMAGALVLDMWPRASAPESRPGGQPGWTEIKWPFAVDLWSVGRAFRCNPAACKGEVVLFVRAKIGFCNCTMGVADDAELERLADLDLFGGRHAADGPGQPISVASMQGRRRSYAIAGTSPAGKSALAIAFNDRCDAIVATAIVSHDRPAAAEQAVLEFLNGEIVLKWVRITLGL